MHNGHKRSLFSLRHDVRAGRRHPCCLFNAAKGSLDLVQRLQLQCKLDVHRGCVNTISWNETGSYILSGSDDQFLNIVNPYSQKTIFSMHSGHRANIFSAKFLPNTSDNHIVSCSGDGMIYFTNVEREDSTTSFNCHFGTVYEVVTVPGDPYSLLSCGEDGTVRWFDLRLKQHCREEDCNQDVLINCRRAVTSLAVDPVHPYYLAVGCSDSSARVFDRRMLGTRLTGSYSGRGITGLVCRFVPPSLKNASHRITSLKYSDNGRQILVSYSSDFIYLFDVDGDGHEPKPSVETNCCEVSAEPSTSRNSGVPNSSSHEATLRQPPVKRLRLRGDWSDTGPHARPERERSNEDLAPRSPGASMMQRMSDMLTRWLNPDAPSSGEEGESQNQAESESGSLHEQEGENELQQQGNVENSQQQVVDNQNLQQREGRTIDSLQAEGGRENSQLQDVGEEGVDKKLEQQVENDQMEVSSHSADELNNSKSDTTVSVVDRCSGLVDSFSANNSASDPQSASPVDSQTLDDCGSGSSVGIRAISHSLEAIDHQILNETYGEPCESSPGIVTSENTVIGSCDMPDTPLSSSQQLNACYNNVNDSARDDGSLPQVDSDSRDLETEVKAVPTVGTSSVLQQQQSDSSGQLEASASVAHAEGSQQYVSGISLHYSSEGTTAGTLKLNFTSRTVESPTGSNVQEPESATSQSQELNDSVASVRTAGSVLTQAIVSSVAIDESMRVSADVPGSRALNLGSTDTGTPSSSTRPVPGLSRERAAIRLQELYRKRQELRDSEEAAAAKDVRQPPVRMCFKGHRNSRTMIKEANFWGDDYVMSGSDCGHIFIWDRHTGQLVNVLEADKHVVNCVQPHPFDPVLASSGIDYNVKLWMPNAEESTFDADKAQKVMVRNQTMLEETRDTITVPASFMLRMLASLNHLRSVGRQASQAREEESSDSDPE